MYDERIKKLRQKLLENHVQAMLVSDFYNIIYLTGFKTLAPEEREAFVVVTQKTVYLMTDGRYIPDASTAKALNLPCEFRLIEPGKGVLFHLQEIIQSESIRTLAFESDNLKYIEYQRLSESLRDVLMKPTDRILISIRAIKDDDEVERIREACSIGDDCLKDIARLVVPGKTEREIAFKMEIWLREKGYGVAFDPIVACDANSALAHYNTKEGIGTVKEGSVILIDMGVKHNNYISDITRMFFMGTPSNEVRHVYEVLAKAQLKAIEMVKPNVSLRDIDTVCREIITAEGLPNYSHSTGHGVGLEVHEDPKVSMYSTEPVKHNQVFTIEPGVYMSGRFGMRIEDTVRIMDGTADILTGFSKEMRILTP